MASSPGNTLKWAVRTALRDARGARGKALISSLGMAMGIAALVAMGSFGADLKRGIHDQTRTMIGADLVFSSRQDFSTEANGFFDSLPGEAAELTRFTSMAFFPNADTAVFSRIRATTAPFPFYGEMVTEPAAAVDSYLDGPYALVEQALINQIDGRVGDPVKLGQKTFTIAGVLTEIPGEPEAVNMMGPRIYISADHLQETQLIQQGSRIFHSMAFKLPKSMAAEGLVLPHTEFLKEQRLRYDTVKKRRENMGKALANLSHFLNLTACLALLIGGVGVTGAVHYHLKQKTRQIAVLRCIGATSNQVTLVYIIQVMTLALVSAVVGVVLGVSIQYVLPKLIATLLPFDFEPTLQPTAILIAVAWGLFISLVLVLGPLAKIRRMSPMLSFRPDLADRDRDPAVWVMGAIASLAWWAFAVSQTDSLKRGSAFMGFLLLALALLYGTSRLVGWLARRFLSGRLPFTWRHGMANLFRPRNQTFIFMIILGSGIFLVTVLQGSRTMLVSQFDSTRNADRPNFIAFDIQTDQLEDVTRIVRDQGFAVQHSVPIVPMRLEMLKGRPVSEYFGTDIPEWTLQREYRSTYRADQTDTEKLVAGAWPQAVGPDTDVIPVTIEADIAKDLQVGLNDRLTMDVMGIPLELEIVGIREVDWQSMQPNFFIVFPEGALEQAPQMYIVTTTTRNPEEVAGLQKSIFAAHPNVSCVDMTKIASALDELIARSSIVVQLLAGLCVGSGLLLLAGAIWSGRYDRFGEHALLRTLGASRRQMAQIVLTEYLFLGVFSAITGLLLALAASAGLAIFLFEVNPFPKPLQVLAPALILPLLTLILGYAGMRGVWRVPPRDVLKREI